jgi:general secretion pathway protein D
MKNSSKKISSKVALAATLVAGISAAPAVHAQNNTFTPGTSAITFITQPVETGPILDVVPYVLSDGYTINMSLIPSLTDFNGYDNPPNIPSVTGNLNVVQLPIVLPDFTIRQVVTSVNVWDNQTVVIGGLISSQVQNNKSKVPVVGDLPLLGRLFQSQSKSTTKKNLMIFVTATIVDPAGNRVHSDDDLPFAQTTVPVQSSGAGVTSDTVTTVHTVQTVQPTGESQ